MPEKKNTETKKYQLYKVAVELNLSREHIIDFLKKKGIEVTRFAVMKIDQELYDEIIKNFKKEKESVTKHKEKVKDFKEKIIKSTETEKGKETQTEKTEEVVKEEITYNIIDSSKTATPKSEEEISKETEIGSKIEEDKKEELGQKTEKEETSTLEVTETGEIVETVTTEETHQQTEIPAESVTPSGKEESELITDQITTPIEDEKVSGEPKETTDESTLTQAPTEVTEEDKLLEKESEKAEEIVDNRAHTTLDEIKNKKAELKVKGKIDLTGGKKAETPEPPRVESKVKPEDKKKDKGSEKPKTTKKVETIVPTQIEEPPKTTKKDKKPKKKKLREEIKKKQVDADADIKIGKVKRVKGVKSIDEKEIDIAIKKTFEEIDGGSVRTPLKKKKKKERIEKTIQESIEREKQGSVLKVTEFMTVNDIAKLMNVGVGEVITKFLHMGLNVTINQRLDFDKIMIIADEYGFTVEKEEELNSNILEDKDDPPETLKPRPPVVTIMGHVDHGKTSLLDQIRKSHIVAGESGGITQHIGAYQVTLPNGKHITFLDTPGHEAFTAMRARGAQVTDIVVLVVAADDSVMPQTVEAINHAKAAGVPIIVAVNKIDKPGINLDRIYKELAEKGIIVEKWGGKYQSSEISAKFGKNIDDLLDKIILEAEMLDLKANPDRPARGVIIEVKLEKGRGTVATVLVKKGTLRVGDPFVAGVTSGRVRALFDEREKKVHSATPGTPVQVLGFNDMPQAGDELIVVESDKIAHEISVQRNQIKKAQDRSLVRHLTLDDISKQIKIGGVKDLVLIVKGDVDGSVEALADSLMKLSTPEVRVSVIHKGVGAIVESDVLLAATSNAIIIGFRVRPNVNARKLAETEKVEIRLYNIIYDVINDVKAAIEGMLAPEISEEIVATVQVRDVYKISKVGTIAGCFVQSGKLLRNNKIRVYRNDMVVYDGRIETLKRFKDDVREVDAGYECGIKIENFNDIKKDDIIESYKIVEKKRKIENVGKN